MQFVTEKQLRMGWSSIEDDLILVLSMTNYKTYMSNSQPIIYFLLVKTYNSFVKTL